jgi:Protein of unknown function (DUF3800)
MVNLCYIDESGTSSIPGNTSHFVLAGISIPVLFWNDADRQISVVLKKYGLENDELHTGWIIRPYVEQNLIPNFDKLDWPSRRSAVEKERTKYLLQLQKTKKQKTYQQAKKTYRHTKAYIHLTIDERRQLIAEVAGTVANWSSARLFAECVDKTHFDAGKARLTVDEQAFEQVVSRFEQYLKNTSTKDVKKYGLLVHDNNQTVAHKHTALMREFQDTGTFWTSIERIVETPLFVDSRLTRLVQIADLCGYALRRYLENKEEALVSKIFERADRSGKKVLGVRHFTDGQCTCEICISHNKKKPSLPSLSKTAGV